MHRNTYRELLTEYREAHQEHKRAFYVDMVKLVDALGGDVGLSDWERALLEDGECWKGAPGKSERTAGSQLDGVGGFKPVTARRKMGP